MLAILDPLYVKYQQPDVSHVINTDTFNCYDFIENPRFLVPETRFLQYLDNFEWSIFSVGSNFWDIIKDQVHIFPGLYVDFGLVLSQREIPYYIWNSYTTKTVYVEEPVVVGDYGTTFVIDIAGNRADTHLSF